MDAAPSSFAPPRHLTKTELSLEFLRERTRSGELAAGQRPALEEPTQLLGMSATPIREALRLLQADRLVDYRPHHGVVVTELPPEVTVEIYRIRSLLEPLATELAVAGRSHEAMMDAIRAGNGAAAAARMREHIESGALTLVDLLEKAPVA